PLFLQCSLPPRSLHSFPTRRSSDLTVNALLVPLDRFVAVSVKLPTFEIVTLCEANTPDANGAVVTGAPTSVPVDVSVAVPVNPVSEVYTAELAARGMLESRPAVADG